MVVGYEGLPLLIHHNFYGTSQLTHSLFFCFSVKLQKIIFWQESNDMEEYEGKNYSSFFLSQARYLKLFNFKIGTLKQYDLEIQIN